MVDLRRGRILRLPDGRGTTVAACAGAVWITEQGSRRDVLLTPGQSFTLARAGLALVQAVRDASVLVDPARDDRRTAKCDPTRHDISECEREIWMDFELQQALIR